MAAAGVFAQSQYQYKYISTDSYLLRSYPAVKKTEYVAIKWVSSYSPSDSEKMLAFTVAELGNKTIRFKAKYFDFFKKDFYTTLPAVSNETAVAVETGMTEAEKSAAMDACRVFEAEVYPSYSVENLLDDKGQEYIPGKNIPFAIYGYSSDGYHGYLLGHDVVLPENAVSSLDSSDKSYLRYRRLSGQEQRKSVAQKLDVVESAQYNVELKQYKDSLRRAEEEEEKERHRQAEQEKKEAREALKYIQKNRVIIFDYDWSRSYSYYSYSMYIYNPFPKAIKRLDFVVMALDEDGNPRWYDESMTVKKIYYNESYIPAYSYQSMNWEDLYYDSYNYIDDFIVVGAKITFADNSKISVNTIDGAMNMYYDRHDISEPEFGWDSIGEIL